jgi:hypothetical protein
MGRLCTRSPIEEVLTSRNRMMARIFAHNIAGCGLNGSLRFDEAVLNRTWKTTGQMPGA